MLGATGAVGSHAAEALAAVPGLSRLTLLGRRRLHELSGRCVAQHAADIFDPASYRQHLAGHHAAICTLGVGQPSKVSKQQFLKVDRDAVLQFAGECREAGIRHFQLLGSIGASPKSRSFYLRSKGELEHGLRSLRFERLSLFRPSMILTPTNRYGWMQAITLKVWPLLTPLLVGRWRKYRGIEVEKLGRAFALNVFEDKDGSEVLRWDDFVDLAQKPAPSLKRRDSLYP